MSQTVTRTDLRDHVKLLAEGKVREVYSLDDSTLLFVATDRISAFDVVLKQGIPQKGALLTQLSQFWFLFLKRKIPDLKTHYISMGIPSTLSASLPEPVVTQLEGRTLCVKRLKIFPLESIVRGYISGSAWSSYKKDGTVNGVALPTGLRESEKLPTPMWTPSTKAEQGQHDENISIEEAYSLVGTSYASKIESLTLQIYQTCAEYALSRGIIIADTKFEFGLDEATGEVVLVDEVLTPDSSRFWRVDAYEVGRSQDSLDKQPLRDWLTREGLKGKEGVDIPVEVVEGTRRAYKEAYTKLTENENEPAV